MLDGARILVVEDEVLHLQSLDRALQTKGCKVTPAMNVPEALDKIAEEKGGFHAAVVDYKLFDRLGSEVVQALCGGDQYTASIMLTGATSRETVSDVFRSGAHYLARKPIAVNELVKLLVSAVDKTNTVRHLLTDASTESLDAPVRIAVIDSGGPSEGEKSTSTREQRARELADRGGLSTRETEVLKEVFIGLKNAVIAGRLGIAERTVKFHISNINKKLHVNNRGELMALLLEDPVHSEPLNGVDFDDD